MMTVEQFPMILADPKAASLLSKILDVLNPAIEAGSILGPFNLNSEYWKRI
jgi:hypothetical protein